MSTKIALASTGPLSGKSTLSRELVTKHGFKRADHSRTVVSSFVAWYNSAIKREPWLTPINEEMVYGDKERYRRGLQEHATLIGFDDPRRAGMWVETTLQQAGYDWRFDDVNIVFEPVRGKAQADALHDLGFTVVQLEISEATREYRAHLMGKSYEQIKSSMQARPEVECGIPNPDIRLYSEASDDPAFLAKIILHPEYRQWWSVA
jgi:hypothetical protein